MPVVLEKIFSKGVVRIVIVAKTLQEQKDFYIKYQ